MLSFLVSFGVRFLYGYSVNVVVGAERDYLKVGRNIVHDASPYTVDIEVVGIHERHTTQQEDSASDFAQ